MKDKPQNSPDENAKFLEQVGALVHGMRANRGMTRKMLAESSSVSERYLANLEQGKGNISINLLRQVADALHTNITDLLPSPKRFTAEHALINDYVSRLPRDEQKRILNLLYRECGDNVAQSGRVALIGLRGAGKTTLGNLLKEGEDLPFIRLVREIERLSGMPVGEIFALSGQQGYRRLEERALLQTLSQYDNCCIETGGSIVSEPKLLNLLLTTCFVIWVKASPEEHMARVIDQGDMRPIDDQEDAMEDLRRILEERTPFYEKAHAVIDTSGKSIDESYREITRLIQANSRQRIAKTG